MGSGLVHGGGESERRTGRGMSMSMIKCHVYVPKSAYQPCPLTSSFHPTSYILLYPQSQLGMSHVLRHSVWLIPDRLTLLTRVIQAPRSTSDAPMAS